MAQIIMPKKQNPLEKILPATGAVIGGILGSEGGAAGAAQGASLGGSLGSFGANMFSSNDQPQQQMSAVDRRMQGGQMPALPDQRAAINNARLELANQSPEVQQQYMPMLTAAALKLRRDQGVA